MGQYYINALFNIAAVSSADGNGGWMLQGSGQLDFVSVSHINPLSKSA
jgi:hypothetical protein